MKSSHLVAILTLVACGPETSSPGTTDDGSTTADASTSTTTTSTTGSTTAGTTDPTTTTGTSAGTTGPDDTTGPDHTTGEPETCSWHLPEHEDLTFCPPPAAMNADVAGTTPFGPVKFHYAHFGLFLCANCPTPDEPSLSLYAELPPQPLDPPGDYFHVDGVDFGFFDPVAQIAGMEIALADSVEVVVEVEPLTVEETSPPLDEGAPPVLTGTITISGDGWDLSGTFDATLCTALDWTPPCE